MTDKYFTAIACINSALTDLKDLADENKLERLAVMIEEAQNAAKEEIMAHNSKSNYDAVMEVVYPYFAEKSH